VGGSGIAVVAHDTVSNEVPGSCHDIVHRKFNAERYHRKHSQVGSALHGLAFNASLAKDKKNGRRRSEAHQLVAGCQMGTSFVPGAGAGYILPASIREEPVIAARDEKGPVAERNLEGRLLSLPMRQDTRLRISAVPAVALRAINLIADLQCLELLHRAVRHKNKRVAAQAVDAAMLTAPVGIEADGKADVRTLVIGEDSSCGVAQQLRVRS
jgi:hypothetical protein